MLTTNLETFLAISLLLLGTVSTATGKIIYVDANAVGANDGYSCGCILVPAGCIGCRLERD